MMLSSAYLSVFLDSHPPHNIVLYHKNLKFKHLIIDIAINFRFSWNFANMKDIIKTYNSTIKISKFTYTKKLLIKKLNIIKIWRISSITFETKQFPYKPHSIFSKEKKNVTIWIQLKKPMCLRLAFFFFFFFLMYAFLGRRQSYCSHTLFSTIYGTRIHFI